MSQEKRVLIKSPTPVASHDSSVYSNDSGGICEKIQPQNVQHKETIRSADPIINDDIADNQLLRAIRADTSNKLGNDALECFQLPNAVVQQSQMHFGTASGNYTKKNTAGPNTELQLQQQNQMILEYQKQMPSLLKIHLLQRLQLQRLLNEEAVRRMQQEITQESAVKEAESMRTQPGMDEIGIVSMDNSPLLHAWNEVNSLDSPEILPPPTLQRIPKRTEGSKVAINEKKQLPSNVRVQMGNDAPKHSIVNIRKNSTLHPCKECGKEFTLKSNMNRHLRTHTGEKPFKCGQCNEAFSHSTTLTDHQRIHTGEKPFKCQICNSAFTQKTALSYHLLTHSNEKQFLCDICQGRFRHKNNLRDHMNTHSKLKPWKCNVCQKSFRHKKTLKKHRHRKRHAEDED